MRTRTLTLLCLLAALPGFAQKSEKYKFGKITAEMLQQKVYSIDSGAHGVVLADVGATDIDLGRGNYAVEYRRRMRIHILDKNAYSEATIKVPVFHSRFGTGQDRLEDVRATTYNLVDGKVVETKMSRDEIFTEKVNRYVDIKKFTLPAVREGCIIEVEYKIYSYFQGGIRGWTFQGRLPRLWTEYTAAIPQFTVFQITPRGYVDLEVTRSQRTIQYSGVAVELNDHTWIGRDVPAFRTEGFISSADNYLSRVEFHLTGVTYPMQAQSLVETWPQTIKRLLEDDDFGGKFDKGQAWLNELTQPFLAGTAEEKARKIFAFVRDEVSCNGQEGLYLTQSIRDVPKKGGSVADVNLLLTAMLRNAGLNAAPAILSTRDNGFVFTTIPMLDRFNYVVVALKLNDQTVYLDASKPRIGYGRLLPECYNGLAQVIEKGADGVLLVTDSLREKSITFVQLEADGAKGWKGSVQQVKGYNDSYESRKKIQDAGMEPFFADLKKSFPMSVRISNQHVDSLKLYDAPVGLRYDLKVETNGEDLIYFNPMLNEALKENPFLSEARLYPVEMPYTLDKTFILRLEVPEGYVVDELPKPVRVGLNDRNEATFQYVVTEADGVVSLRSQIRFDRANYQPDEYEVLREFYIMILAKQREQIVFKKKK